MKYCPVCERELWRDTEVYVKRGRDIHKGYQIVGCDGCVRCGWGDEFWEEDELEDSEADNYLWDMSKEMKALMSYRTANAQPENDS